MLYFLQEDSFIVNKINIYTIGRSGEIMLLWAVNHAFIMCVMTS